MKAFSFKPEKVHLGFLDLTTQSSFSLAYLSTILPCLVLRHIKVTGSFVENSAVCSFIGKSSLALYTQPEEYDQHLSGIHR